MVRVPEREKKKHGAERIFQENYAWKVPKYGERQKPTDPRSQATFKQSKPTLKHKIVTKLPKSKDKGKRKPPKKQERNDAFPVGKQQFKSQEIPQLKPWNSIFQRQKKKIFTVNSLYGETL